MSLDDRLPLTLLYARRINRKFLRRPASVVFSMMQPLTWLVLIGWVLDRSGLTVSGVPYLTWFVSTAVALTIGYASFQGGIGTAREIEGGFARRLVLLGADPLHLVLGRCLSDVAKGVLQSALLVALGAALGAELTDRLLGWLVFFCVVVGSMLAGLGTANMIAAAVRHSETTVAIAVVVIPVGLLVSDAYVPLDDLPAVVRIGAAMNPVAYALRALRDASTGSPLAQPAMTALALAAIGMAGMKLAAPGLAPRLVKEIRDEEAV